MPVRLLLLAAVLLLATAPVPAVAEGYLAREAAPDAIAILPPPPAPGSKAQAADQEAFTVTRRLKDQPRWSLATSDNKGSPQDGLDDFACALGVRLDGANAPTLLALFGRMGQDARLLIAPAKERYARKRPYLAPSNLAAKAPICVPRVKALDDSGAYPSGHTTLGWAWALVLAELAPDRATQILSRGRSYGESRVVCGVHWVSDIEAGSTNGAALVAALHGNAAFRADLDKARAEVEAARRSAAPAASAGQCAVPDAAAAHRPW